MSHAPRTDATAGATAYQPFDLADAIGGRLLRTGRGPVRGAAVDSRRVTPGACFFALPGERTDGHRFLADAVRAGASALVVTRTLPDAELDALAAGHPGVPGGLTVVQVADSLEALQRAAAAWRARFDPLVVGVTGSIGKTSVKEATAEVLAARLRVLRNEGNENNEVGLPLTLLRLDHAHEAAVLEMGMYVPGEIARLAALARPRVGVVTAVRGVHLSRASTLDAIERGKGELVEALPPDGTAVLNADDERVARMARRTPAASLTYGFGVRADVRAEGVESAAEGGMRFVLRTPLGDAPAATPALGRHSVHNHLAAAAVGVAAGLDLATIVQGIGRGFRAPHRNTLVRAGEWRILDDTYNAAPDSMAAALDLLATLPGRRVAVLGEMLELGEGSEVAHHELGGHAARVVERLVLVGHGVGGVHEGAVAAGLPARSIQHAADLDAAFALLVESLLPGDVVLVKGSRGVALDLLVDRLVEHQGGIDAAAVARPAGTAGAAA